MTLTTGLLKEWYEKFNNEFFNGELPTKHIDLQISKTKRALGQCGILNLGFIKVIKISNFYKRNEIEYQTTLIHEMIHLYEYIKHGTMSHGRFFKIMAQHIYAESNQLYNISRTTYKTYEVNEQYAKRINQPIVLFKDSNNRNCAIYPTKKLLDYVINFIGTRHELKIIGYGYVSSQKYQYGSVCKSRFRYYYIDNIDEIISHLKENKSFVKLYD